MESKFLTIGFGFEVWRQEFNCWTRRLIVAY